ncbi:DUF2207 domain-containing protein [Agromyces badenianii]|uniref:DUF2207 domain-containing protein n=1 Tax=Agromyces badenianii TaxID=2080742 RepID=UPI001F3AF35A|nr:DUF2207 domain-containing protein [Agromyces badenianii]
MVRFLVPALPQVIADLANAGAGTEQLAAPAGSGLSTAILPIIALAASLTAAVCVGTLIVSWLRPPVPGDALAVVDPETAGILPVGFVSGEAATRWLPATVVLLAVNGVIAIEDRRDIREAPDLPEGERGRAKDIRLVFDGEYPLAPRADVEHEGADGTVIAMLAPGLVGGSRTLKRGASVVVDRVVTNNGPLLAVTRDGFRDAADWYREKRPALRFRVTTFAGLAGVVLGFISLTLPDDPSKSVAWSAIVIGAVAVGLRVFLPRAIPLNAAGMQLRARANELRAAIEGADVPSVAAGEKLLPWAVRASAGAPARCGGAGPLTPHSRGVGAGIRRQQPSGCRDRRQAHRARRAARDWARVAAPLYGARRARAAPRGGGDRARPDRRPLPARTRVRVPRVVGEHVPRGRAGARAARRDARAGIVAHRHPGARRGGDRGDPRARKRERSMSGRSRSQRAGRIRVMPCRPRS